MTCTVWLAALSFGKVEPLLSFRGTSMKLSWIKDFRAPSLKPAWIGRFLAGALRCPVYKDLRIPTSEMPEIRGLWTMPAIPSILPAGRSGNARYGKECHSGLMCFGLYCLFHRDSHYGYSRHVLPIQRSETEGVHKRKKRLMNKKTARDANATLINPGMCCILSSWGNQPRIPSRGIV